MLAESNYSTVRPPRACAAALATLDLYRDEALFARARSLEPYRVAAVHNLTRHRHVIDIRLVAGTELAPTAARQAHAPWNCSAVSSTVDCRSGQPVTPSRCRCLSSWKKMRSMQWSQPSPSSGRRSTGAACQFHGGSWVRDDGHHKPRKSRFQDN